MSELLPCPFCGGDPKLEQTGKDKMKIRCRSCGIKHEQRCWRFSMEWLEQKMVENWNQRHTPEGWQLVPSPGTTGKMDDAVRGFLLLLSGGSPLTYERARNHCKRYHGPQILESWPDHALNGEGHIPKAAQADLLYRMMLAAAPTPGGNNGP